MTYQPSSTSELLYGLHPHPMAVFSSSLSKAPEGNTVAHNWPQISLMKKELEMTPGNFRDYLGDVKPIISLRRGRIILEINIVSCIHIGTQSTRHSLRSQFCRDTV